MAEAAVVGETATGVTMAGMVSAGALKGAAIFGTTGMVVDGFKGALTYMEDHNNLDGSGGYILESACSHVGGNVIKGAIVGGFFGAVKFRLDNPRNALPQNSPGEMLPEGGSGRTFKSQYEIPTRDDGYTKSNLDLGKKVHKEYKASDVDNITKFKEYTLPSGKRVDFIDFENKTIYELKPYNPRQIKNGIKQLENYLKEIEDVYGNGWTTVLDTY